MKIIGKWITFLSCSHSHFRVLTDSFIGPLQEKLEEWKKTASQLEKDHSKGKFVPFLMIIKSFAILNVVPAMQQVSSQCLRIQTLLLLFYQKSSAKSCRFFVEKFVEIFLPTVLFSVSLKLIS